MMADEVFMQKSPLSSGGREPPCISVEDSSRSSVNYKPGLPDSRNCDSNGAKDPMKSPLSRKPASARSPPARSPPARSPPARSPPARPPPTRSPPVRPPPSRSLPACSPSTLSPVQLDPAIASEDLEISVDCPSPPVFSDEESSDTEKRVTPQNGSEQDSQPAASSLPSLPEDSAFTRSSGSLTIKPKTSKPKFTRRFTEFVSSVRGKAKGKESRSTSVHFPVTQPKHLDDTSKEDRLLCKVVKQSFSYLNRPHVLKEEGLFRIPGNGTDVKQLSAAFKAGKDVDLSEICDPNTIASLLKHHFKTLRAPLVSLKVQRDLVYAMRETDISKVKTILRSCSTERFSSLQTMIDILTKVLEYSEYNKMCLTNMGTACGLSIFSGMTPTNANDMLIFVLHHKEEIFS